MDIKSFKEQSLKDLEKEIEALEREERIFNQKHSSVLEMVDGNLSSLKKLIPEVEEKLAILKSFEGRSNEIRTSLTDENFVDSLSIEELDKLEYEASDMISQIESLFSVPEPIPEKAIPIIPISEPKFRTHKIYKPRTGINSPLAQYRVFQKLTREEDRVSYEALLRIRGIKIEILGLIGNGIYDQVAIKSKLGTTLVAIEDGLDKLIDFGQISIDGKYLSKDSERAVSLYKFIKEKAKEDRNYAALAIYPMIMYVDRRSPTQLENFTGLDRYTIDLGAELLASEYLITISKGIRDMVYSGKTEKSKNLNRLINERYIRVRF